MRPSPNPRFDQGFLGGVLCFWKGPRRGPAQAHFPPQPLHMRALEGGFTVGSRCRGSCSGGSPLLSGARGRKVAGSGSDVACAAAAAAARPRSRLLRRLRGRARLLHGQPLRLPARPAVLEHLEAAEARLCQEVGGAGRAAARAAGLNGAGRGAAGRIGAGGAQERVGWGRAFVKSKPHPGQARPRPGPGQAPGPRPQAPTRMISDPASGNACLMASTNAGLGSSLSWLAAAGRAHGGWAR
jgi:hypothetical protein